MSTPRHMTLTPTIGPLGDIVMPDSLQAEVLRSALHDHDRSLQDLDAHIHQLETQLCDLYLQRHALIAASARKKALIAPIRRLAPETLGYVFELVCHGESPIITSDSTPLQLGRVCKRWRRIALGTPQLWTNIALECTTHATLKMNPFTVITEWLRRSGGLFINIYLGDGLERVFNAPQHAALFRACMEFMGEHFHRCQSFHITNAFPQVLRAMFPRGKCREASSLRDFRVIPSMTSLPLEKLAFGHINAPNLEKIDVYRPSTFFDSIAFDYSRLRSLRWNTSKHRNDHESSLDALAQVLELCTNLQECEIVHPSHSAFSLDKAYMTVPSLQHLSLKFTLHADPTPLLSILRTPNLRSLSLEQTSSISNIPGFGGALASFLSHSPNAPLKDLSLTNLNFSGEDTPFLGALARVESLNFKKCFLQDAFMEGLAPRDLVVMGAAAAATGLAQPQQQQPSPDSWPVPKLTALVFNASMFTAETLARVVEKRLRIETSALNSEYTPSLGWVSLIGCRPTGDVETVRRAALGVMVDIVEAM